MDFTRPRHFGLLMASSLAMNMLALALPLMTMQVYDRILTNRAADTLIVLSAGVLIAAVMEFALRSCRSMVTGLNGAQYEHSIASAALKALLEAEPRHTAQLSSARLAQDIGAAGRLKDYYGGQMTVTLLIDVPFVLFFLGFEAYLAGWLALVPCAVLGVFLSLSWRQGMALRVLMEARERADSARYSFITESLKSVHSIKALCLEAPMARRFEEVQRGSGPVNYRIACLHGQTASLSYGFAQLMTVAVLCAGAPMAAASHITTGTLIACVLLSGQVMQPLQRGLSMWVLFQDIVLAKERLRVLFALPRRHFMEADPAQAYRGEVKLRQVRFGYRREEPVFDGAEITIAPGKAVAITGASGSGKTTLLELIAGIYAPDGGQVLVDGRDAARIPLAERPRAVAYLPMHGMILRGSIMDNLTGFNAQSHTEARLVAEQLGIEQTVSLLPSGYDTPLEGQLTDVISPGLKQRISIARALVKRPRLILFDNADHGMDHESYARIFELMAKLKGKATLLMVSEDRNILSLADTVVELRQGRLVPMGMPLPLIAPRKLFSRRSA